jgi:hypothetical protein
LDTYSSVRSTKLYFAQPAYPGKDTHPPENITFYQLSTQA